MAGEKRNPAARAGAGGASGLSQAERRDGPDTTPPAPIEQDLGTLANEIEHEHEAANQAARAAVEHAIRAGELLLEAKRQVPHGRWEKWIARHTSLKPRTARSYMQIAALDAENRHRVAELPLREALKAVAKHKHLPPQERAGVVQEENRRKWEERHGPPTIEAEHKPLPPPEPIEPASPRELADNLIDQLVEAAEESDIPAAELVAACARRFGADAATAPEPVTLNISPSSGEIPRATDGAAVIPPEAFGSKPATNYADRRFEHFMFTALEATADILEEPELDVPALSADDAEQAVDVLRRFERGLQRLRGRLEHGLSRHRGMAGEAGR